jgi:rubrerythrin
MTTEQNKVLEALQAAIKMETDGKKFYLRASAQSSNDAGKKLLKTLAAEEDIHRQNFEVIYEALRHKKGWPNIAVKRAGKGLRTVFNEAAGKVGKAAKALASEIGAVQTAMEMENKSYDFYRSQLKTATSDAAKSFYEVLSVQEKEHHRLLLDYFEFLKDPAAWFVKAEHHSLDGG